MKALKDCNFSVIFLFADRKMRGIMARVNNMEGNQYAKNSNIKNSSDDSKQIILGNDNSNVCGHRRIVLLPTGSGL